jgi:hypothetical protein
MKSPVSYLLLIAYVAAYTLQPAFPVPARAPVEVKPGPHIHHIVSTPVLTTVPYAPDSSNPADTLHPSADGEISVKDFGAKCDGITDDYIADSSACAYCIANPRICSTVSFPIGHSRITKPLLLQHVVGGENKFFTIHLKGALPNKSASDAYLSAIICDFKRGFGLGIELGRGILIENLTILGKYTFPNKVKNYNIGTLKYSDWNDGSVTDSRYSPYAGICIDPYPSLQGGRGGTSGVEIRQCAVKQWMVGVMLTPNATTANAEMINIVDNDIEACKVAIAIGQDQSKEIHIDRLKCWASTHTILDGINYGRGTGGGSVMIEGMNIAGNVNQLFNLSTDRFPLSAKDIYSESLFRIGAVGCGAGANFINFQIDFLTGPGMPAPDYLLLGCANFYGGMLRYYDNSPTHRLNLSGFAGILRDMTVNNQPIIVGLYGGSTYPTPFFDNVHNYYHGGNIKNTTDSLIKVRPRSLTINNSTWTGVITGISASVGDYILGSPTSTTRKFYDPAAKQSNCNTLQIGRVIKISGDSLFLDDVGLNVLSQRGYDAIYISKIK